MAVVLVGVTSISIGDGAEVTKVGARIGTVRLPVAV